MSKLNKYFSQGQFYQEVDQVKQFKPRQASPSYSKRIYQRNYVNQFDHDFKPINKNSHKDATLENFNKNNFNVTSNNLVFDTKSVPQSHHDLNDNIHQQRYNQQHPINFKVHKTKEFSKKSQQQSVQALSKGNLISKEQYDDTKNSNTLLQTQSQTNLLKSHSYISKPLLRLNGGCDFVPNVQMTSGDAPDWVKLGQAHYTPDKLMGGREYRRMMKNLPKVDIMGQKLHDNPKKEKQFELCPPDDSLKAERHRMVVIDCQYPKKQKDLYDIEYLRKSKLEFKWKENQQVQKFDQVNLPKKIGFTNTPAIKCINVIEKLDAGLTNKIGKEVRVPLIRNKPIAIKIGKTE